MQDCDMFMPKLTMNLLINWQVHNKVKNNFYVGMQK